MKPALPPGTIGERPKSLDEVAATREVKRVYSEGCHLKHKLVNYGYANPEDGFYEATQTCSETFERLSDKAFRMLGTVKTKNARAVTAIRGAYNEVYNLAAASGLLDSRNDE